VKLRSLEFRNVIKYVLIRYFAIGLYMYLLEVITACSVGLVVVINRVN